MHSGATPLLRGCSRKNIFCQKIFDNFFSFQATEMVLTSKWGRIQQEIQIWADHLVATSWTLVRSPWKWEKMFIQLISATRPSSPAVQYTIKYNDCDCSCWSDPAWIAACLNCDYDRLCQTFTMFFWFWVHGKSRFSLYYPEYLFHHKHKNKTQWAACSI